MPPFVIALIIVVGGLWLIRKAGRSKPAEMRQLLQKLGGYAALGFAALLAFKGQIGFASGLLVVGLGLIGKTSLLPQGFSPWANKPNENAPPPPQPPQRSDLKSDEALAILGLKKGATAEDVRQAHKRLMKDFHPDKGGTDYLASKINAAKDVLLNQRS